VRHSKRRRAAFRRFFVGAGNTGDVETVPIRRSTNRYGRQDGRTYLRRPQDRSPGPAVRPFRAAV